MKLNVKVRKLVNLYDRGMYGASNNIFNSILFSYDKKSDGKEDCILILEKKIESFENKKSSFFHYFRLSLLLSIFRGRKYSFDYDAFVSIIDADDFCLKNIKAIRKVYGFSWAFVIELLYQLKFKDNKNFLGTGNYCLSRKDIEYLKGIEGFDMMEYKKYFDISLKRKIFIFCSYLPVYSNKKIVHFFLLKNLILKIKKSLPDFDVRLVFTDNSHPGGNDPRSYEKKYYANLSKEIKDHFPYYVGLSEDEIVGMTIKESPDYLFFLGGVFESKPVRHKLYNQFPILFLFFNQKNRVDKKIDIAITNKKFKMNGNLDPDKLMELNLPVLVNDSNAVYDVTDVKKKNNEITMVTALTNNRIADAFSKYTKPQLNDVFTTLEDNEAVRWVMLGPKSKEAIFKIDERFERFYIQGRLDIIEFEENLSAYLSHCDLFVSFPGFGGGGTGGVIARFKKCPVLCFEGSDICLKEVPNLIEKDEKSFYETLKELLNNKTEREKRAIKQYNYLNENFLNIDSEKFHVIIKKAKESFYLRKKHCEKTL